MVVSNKPRRLSITIDKLLDFFSSGVISFSSTVSLDFVSFIVKCIVFLVSIPSVSIAVTSSVYLPAAVIFSP